MARNGEINPQLRHCQIKIISAEIFHAVETFEEPSMSDQSVAAIARNLANAMMTRARTRLPDDQKVVLALQTQLVAEIFEENKTAAESLVLN